MFDSEFSQLGVESLEVGWITGKHAKILDSGRGNDPKTAGWLEIEFARQQRDNEKKRSDAERVFEVS
jgi:hypothetical protein